VIRPQGKEEICGERALGESLGFILRSRSMSCQRTCRDAREREKGTPSLVGDRQRGTRSNAARLRPPPVARQPIGSGCCLRLAAPPAAVSFPPLQYLH
jgi:hypothetical protein